MSIEWTDETWNPMRGCSRVSPGCQHCYAEVKGATGRLRPHYGHLIRHTSRGPVWTGEVELKRHKLDEPRRRSPRKPTMYFVNSMSDFFHKGFTDAEIAEVFEAMRRAPWHAFQVLTKRAARMREWCSAHPELLGAHIWLGISVEDQIRAQERIPELLAVEGVGVRFLSIEPLLETVDLTPWLAGLDWVIAGGESKRGARPCKIDWLLDVVSQCRGAGVPVFVKQTGSVFAREHGYRHQKGGDMDEWPQPLRVREFPAKPEVEAARGETLALDFES